MFSPSTECCNEDEKDFHSAISTDDGDANDAAELAIFAKRLLNDAAKTCLRGIVPAVGMRAHCDDTAGV
jgi:hypothetical protein